MGKRRKVQEESSPDIRLAHPILRLMNMVLHEAINLGHTSVRIARLKDRVQFSYGGKNRDAPPLRLWTDISACLWLFEYCSASSRLFQEVRVDTEGEWRLRFVDKPKVVLRRALRLLATRVHVALSTLA